MKYLKDFKTLAEANAQGALGLDSPHVDIIDETDSVNVVNVTEEKFTCHFNTNGVIENVVPVVPPVTGHTLGEIAYWDGTKLSYKHYTEWDASLGTAIAVCVIPSSHAEVWGDGKARFLSVKGMTSAGTESNEECKMYWRPADAGEPYDTPLSAYTKVPTWNNSGTTSVGAYGCLSSDSLPDTLVENSIDRGTYYKTTPYVPSPYAADGSFYADYKRTITGNNGLSDFNGKENTAILNGIDNNFVAANACGNFSTLGTNAGDWYLPAIGELGYLVPRFKVIEDAIAKVGGTPFVTVSEFQGNNYWSSTEGYCGGTAPQAWRLYLITMNVNGNNNKNYEYYVRPFIKLL